MVWLAGLEPETGIPANTNKDASVSAPPTAPVDNERSALIGRIINKPQIMLSPAALAGTRGTDEI